MAAIQCPRPDVERRQVLLDVLVDVGENRRDNIDAVGPPLHLHPVTADAPGS
jgi:hypothetical protein